jgi:hypothetical protein
VREAVAGCNACDGMCFCFFWKHHKNFRKWRQKWGDVDAGPKDGEKPSWQIVGMVEVIRSELPAFSNKEPEGELVNAQLCNTLIWHTL